MEFFKNYKIYNSYTRILRKNRVELESKFNIRIDRANRMYTVVNVPSQLDEPYNLRKSDIDTLSEKYLKEYIANLSAYLNSIGLNEVYDFYEPIKKVSKYSYLIVIGFNLINSVKFYDFIYYRVIPFSLLLISCFIAYKFFS